MCNTSHPCNGRHCYLCGKGNVHWFHLPANYKVRRVLGARHRKTGFAAYFGI